MISHKMNKFWWMCLLLHSFYQWLLFNLILFFSFLSMLFFLFYSILFFLFYSFYFNLFYSILLFLLYSFYFILFYFVHSSDDHRSNFHRKADIGNYNSISESQNNNKEERNDEILLSGRYQSRQISLGWGTS